MREIYFKALKDDRSEWVYGCYNYGVIYPDSIKKHTVNGWGIDENTLCQFTGKKDKQGVYIYEGDVNQDGGICKWNNDSASFTWEYEQEIHEFGSEQDWCEITGNVYNKSSL